MRSGLTKTARSRSSKKIPKRSDQREDYHESLILMHEWCERTKRGFCEEMIRAIKQHIQVNGYFHMDDGRIFELKRRLHMEDPIIKVCHKCETSKWGSEFYRNKRSHDGLQAYCKECWKAYPNAKAACTRYDKERRIRHNRPNSKRVQSTTRQEHATVQPRPPKDVQGTSGTP